MWILNIYFNLQAFKCILKRIIQIYLDADKKVIVKSI